MNRLLPLAAVSAAMAIAAGAFGAHAAELPASEWLKTGAQYQLIHAVAVLVLADRFSGPSKAIFAGSLIFALSLYAMALGGPRWLGAVTPLGGASMIAGWLSVAYLGWASRKRSSSASDTDLST